MSAWYIDALDDRGGLAFASLRKADQETDLADAEATVFISAPSFTAEPVLDRTIGHAATRGAFQWGLFTEESGEVPFARLDDVREFVRRVFVGSGGGDTPGEGEGPPPTPEGGRPPPLTEGEGERPREGGEDTSLADQIRAATNKFLNLQPSEIGEAGNDMSWSALRTASFPGTSLEHGLVILFQELLKRLPTKGDQTALLKWTPAFGSFWVLAERLGATAYLADPYRRLPEEFRSRLAACLGFPEGDEIETIRRWRYYLWPHWYYMPLGDYEIDDLLARLPIPKPLADEFPETACEKEFLSLLSLLEIALAVPQKIAEMPPEACSLLMVAGAAVAVGGHDIHQPWWPPYDAGSRIYRAHIAELESVAAGWLAKVLPALALPKPIEELIMTAPSLKYAGADA